MLRNRHGGLLDGDWKGNRHRTESGVFRIYGEMFNFRIVAIQLLGESFGFFLDEESGADAGATIGPGFPINDVSLFHC
jgi:hypothetical protein